MVAVQVQEPYDELWFFTRDDSPKIREIARNPEVLLSYAEPKGNNYVSIAGTAGIVNDRAKIKTLWSEWMRTWFPQGPDDAHIALIRVNAVRAEYWDAPSSAFVYAYGYVKARLTGEMPKAGEHRKVAM
jgi:general stress protein 26